MYHPFQKIARVQQEGSQFLLAASGPLLSSINVQDGTVAARWSSVQQDDSSQARSAQNGDAGQDRPHKRQRIEPLQAGSSITHILPTPNGKHVVIVTAEDKSVHVLEVLSNGSLRHISQRCMSKRPSALSLIDNGTTIVVADKFGDVYSLPLLPTQEQESAAKKAAGQAAKPLRVMASESTVHSKANLKSLEFQRKQSGEGALAKIKDTMEFAHDFLLGHVSMITDLIAAELPIDSSLNVRLTHILTSDRDEHIRVSRGPPQSFIIERYCLGHKGFVSKMCLFAPDILVSGGGDDSLFVWKISDGSLLYRVPLLPLVAQASQTPEAETRLAISGLWSYNIHGNQNLLLVAIEGKPLLLYCELPLMNFFETLSVNYVRLSGNLLDLAIVDDLVIVSLDNIHVPGSTKEVDEIIVQKPRLQVVDVHRGHDELRTRLQARLVEANEIVTADWHERDLQILLYSTGSLRKQNDSAQIEIVEAEAV